MIVSENVDAAVKAFVPILDKAVLMLKRESVSDSKKYLESSGTKLEGLVLEALNAAAYGTEFEGSIRLASGLKFPDIVLKAGGIGVEVKSTVHNHWITTGNSVLESTRIPDIKKIFLMFGKLASPVDFKVRPYEECLKEVMVTHYPRYQIDMDLPVGQTIFDKIGMCYDELRSLREPITPIIEYYSSRLRPGESLWWAGNRNVKDESSPITIREFSSLGANERAEVIARSFVLFPQLFGSGQDKFHDILVWLLRNGIVCGNIRDFYTAGGKWRCAVPGGAVCVFPQIVRRFYESKDRFLRIMEEVDADELGSCWGIPVKSDSDRIGLWMSFVEKYTGDKLFCSFQKILRIEQNAHIGVKNVIGETRVNKRRDECVYGNQNDSTAENIAEALRFREYLPLYSLRAACGHFGDGEQVECEGWVKACGCGQLDDKMFVVRASGRSMEPRIHDGDLCVMRADGGGSRQGKIVLAQHRSISDPDTGGAYSIKVYESEKDVADDGSWRHRCITLKPLNAAYRPISVDPDSPDDFRIVAEFIGTL